MMDMIGKMPRKENLLPISWQNAHDSLEFQRNKTCFQRTRLKNLNTCV